MRAPIGQTVKAALFAAALLVAAAPGRSGALAAETITVGSVGSASTNLWPSYIGITQGFFAAENIDIDFIFVQSSAGVLQQVAAGAIDLSAASGLVDPIHAIDKGAAVAILRIDVQAPPYTLLGRPEIKTIEGLKGKTISVGGLKDITRIFLERMLGPHGLAPGSYDMVFAGATSARLQALQSGAVDAALLTAPYNFHAEAAGFSNLGLAVDYVKDLPFAGTAVNRSWAAGHAALAAKYLAAYTRSIAWFDDDANRQAAIKIMMDVSKEDESDVAKSYDFLRHGNFFEPTGQVSRAKLGALLDVLKGFDDVDRALTVDRLVLPGLTRMAD